jgi:hypothetical protein
LRGKEVIFKINHDKLMWQEYGLADEHILEYMNIKNNDLDES